MSKPNPALREFLSDICEKYLKACCTNNTMDRSYEMGRAHGALMLMTQMGQDNDEGWTQWDNAFDAANNIQKAVPSQEVGVG